MNSPDTLKDTCPHRQQCLTSEECDRLTERATDTGNPSNPAFWGARLLKKGAPQTAEEVTHGADLASKMADLPTLTLTVEATGQWRVVARRSEFSTPVVGFAGTAPNGGRLAVMAALRRAASLFGLQLVEAEE